MIDLGIEQYYQEVYSTRTSTVLIGTVRYTCIISHVTRDIEAYTVLVEGCTKATDRTEYYKNWQITV